MMKDATIRCPMGMGRDEFNRAAERGRLMAAQVMANDPVQRMIVEEQFGIEYCKQRYPEAYSEGMA